MLKLAVSRSIGSPRRAGIQDVERPGPDTRFAPLAFPDVAVTLADLLG